jgi:hypothetical protein
MVVLSVSCFARDAEDWLAPVPAVSPWALCGCAFVGVALDAAGVGWLERGRDRVRATAVRACVLRWLPLLFAGDKTPWRKDPEGEPKHRAPVWYFVLYSTRATLPCISAVPHAFLLE